MNNIKREIDLLVEKINKWNDEYFNFDSPTVSDKVYDTALRKLVKLETQYPEYISNDSPTANVGSNIVNKFKKIVHKQKMLSLDKAYSLEDIQKFINNVKKITKNENINFYLEPKIDGLSIALQYEDGKLVRALTRGDGTTGEDVTDNVFNIISDIPSSIDYKKNIEIRGEIYISKSNFAALKNIDSKFANPRNMASGTLRQNDRNIVRERRLSCFVYEIVSPELHKMDSFHKSLLFLTKQGFRTLNNGLITSDINKINDYLMNFEKSRSELDFETDGIVIKLDEIQHYNELGFTSKFPKYNIAYKFNDELVETKLIGITVTIGRTGMVTYNAQLEPVLLKGTVVSAATLHNFNYIDNLNINIGDDVLIKKAGEIIPKVFALSKKNNKEKYQKENKCPFCKEMLIDNELMTDQFCVNNLCPEISIRKIIHFASRQAMNITGLGESWVRKFYELEMIKKYPDIYLLSENTKEIMNIPRIGDKFLNNLLREINNSKKNSLTSILFAIGINHLGDRNCKIVASKIGSLENFIEFNFTTLNEIKDLGPITINSLIEFQKNNENMDDLRKLISLGINPTYEIIDNNNESFFTNKKFVITGKFSMSRNEIKSIVEKNGGKVISAISPNIDYLICGDDFGTKKTKADELNVKILYENSLIELIKEL
ncbi:MAG: NAD-dependent DNA ligase LigA [Metamycoplasmataceae bacterium]